MKKVYMNKFFYPLIENPYSNKDIQEGIRVLKSKQLTLSKETLKFEKSFTRKLNSDYSLMVNSGSSANLLALQCLINPYRKNRLKVGDEIIIPTLCWSTSLWPIIQSNLKPVFVDINKNTLNIDEKSIEKKITKKTKAIMLVHVLGNTCNMDVIMRIKKKYNLFLIEDTCESLGTKYKKQYLGTFGEFSSFSFYSSHQISSGEGGTAGTASNEVEIYGISFAVNDNLSVSVNQMDRTVQHVSAADVTEETTGFGASYTMGSASIRILNAETSNLGGVSTAKDVEHTEISLMLAF